MPKHSATRNTDGANARAAYERADENPFVWRPFVKRLPDEKLTTPAFVWLVPTTDEWVRAGGVPSARGIERRICLAPASNCLQAHSCVPRDGGGTVVMRFHGRGAPQK